MSQRSVRGLLFGETRGASVGWSLFALALVALWIAAPLGRGPLGALGGTPFEPLADAAALVVVAVTLSLPALQAYRNEGWVPSVLLAAAPGAALGTSGWLIVGGTLPWAARVRHGLLVGIASGVVLGTVGFALGVGLSWWRGGGSA